MGRQRLDTLLVDLGHCDSREQAKRLILAGEVKVNDAVAAKPGSCVLPDDNITIKEKPRYVGRGGLKLQAALDAFAISVEGSVSLDIGSSTGGFTDCLLQHGAKKVFAIDAGTNQLAWKLRSDPRVDSREKFNARYLRLEDLGASVDIVVVDVSFISLTKILPSAYDVLKEDGDLVCLIKPQFELQKSSVGRGGVVRSAELHDLAVEKIKHFIERVQHAEWKGLIESPIRGANGNREFLAWSKRSR